MMSRASMFRVSEGVAVDMNNRIFKLPSFHGTIHSSYKLYCYWLIAALERWFIVEND